MPRTISSVNARAIGLARGVLAQVQRERQFLLSQVLEIKGLMPLLMKPRNSREWTAEDKAEIRAHLKRLTALSPYLVVVVMPGGFFMLPALSWWLDRRRNRAAAPGKSVEKTDQPPRANSG